MRLLIFTPTWIQPDGKDAMHPDCAAAIQAQRISGRIDWVISRDNPYPIGDCRNVTNHYIAAQKLFLEKGYDALLTVEHDNVLPDPGAAQRLLDTDGDVVYAPYLLRHGTHVLNLWQYIGGRNLGSSLSLYPTELRQAQAAGVWRVCGVGHGCTLFRRRVLEAVPFRYPDDGSHNSADIPFAVDAQAAGFVSVARMDVPVLHIEGDLRLHPFERVALTKYQAAQSVNVLLDGAVVKMIKGQWYELTPEQAADLSRAGFIGIPDKNYKVGPLAPPETATADPVERTAVEQRPRRRKAVTNAIS